MVVCKNIEDYKILKSLRSHGWVRDIEISKKFPNLDPRYIFVNSDLIYVQPIYKLQ